MCSVFYLKTQIRLYHLLCPSSHESFPFAVVGIVARVRACVAFFCCYVDFEWANIYPSERIYCESQCVHACTCNSSVPALLIHILSCTRKRKRTKIVKLCKQPTQFKIKYLKQQQQQKTNILVTARNGEIDANVLATFAIYVKLNATYIALFSSEGISQFN